MSDEALNAHLDWLDKCAQEQGDIYDALLEKTIAQLKEENAALSELLSHLVDVEMERDKLKRENELLETEIYDAIFYEPHGTDSWGKLTHRQLMALNEIGRRLAYKRQERALLEEQADG